MITVIDTETVGFEPPAVGEGVVEFAAVRLGAVEEPSWFHSLVKPTCPIEIQAMAAHHITEEMVASADSLESVLKPISNDISGIYCAHNAAFDKKFLPAWLSSRRWICTWRCALHLWPDAPGHSNQVLRYYLGLKVQDMPEECGTSAHRALYDAWVTAKLLDHMLDTLLECREEFAGKTVDDAVNELLRLSTAPVLLKKIRFGKHAGTAFEDIDRGYLRWVVGQKDMDADVLHTAQHWLNQGKKGWEV